MASRIVLIGAGSAQFGLGTLSDIFASEVLEGSHIVLHDINAQALKRVEGIAQDHLVEHDLPFTVSATIDRKEALQGADFCVIAIEVGDRFELWEQDWKVPLQYGIPQVFGENGGPGGLFHALRIVPPILEICEDIQAIAPEAHVFNFSNPMTRICLTVNRAFPDLSFTGLCHEIATMPQHLPEILGLPWERLEITAGGLNHFSVLLEVRDRQTGEDLYPELREKAADYFARLPDLAERVAQMRAEETGSTPGAEPALREGATAWPERWLFREIFEKFGYLPITSDSHFGEYIQWAHDVVDHRAILDFFRFYKEWVTGKEPEMGEPSDVERVVPIMEGILTDSGHEELAVNIMNDGLILNLYHDLVVEVPATVDADGLHGIPLGALPKGIAGLLRNQVSTLDLTAEAILQKSRGLALQAMLVDPVVDGVQAAEQALDTIIRMQRPYLDYLK
jgi:alpha-galactosidase